jgi:hypothetical protein
VKRLELLSVPLAIAAAALFATPAVATQAKTPAVTLTVVTNCTQTGKFCFDFTATTANLPPAGGDLVVTLAGLDKNNQPHILSGAGQGVHLDRNTSNKTFRLCVPAPPDTTFVQFVVQVHPVQDLSVTLNGSDVLHLGPGGVSVLALLDNNCQMASPSPSSTPTPAPTPTPTPAPSASAAATALAQTGGFDLRLLAVGVVVLLLGGILLLVSTRRGSPSSSR